jgi:hypothetical protein
MSDEECHLPTKKVRKVVPPENLIRVEINRKNDKVFDGKLSREDLIEVWSALRQDKTQLDGIATIQIRGRSLRVNYRVKEPILIGKKFKKPDFEWERTNALGNTDFFSGRVLGFSTLEAEIGDIVTVCVNRTALEFTNEQIRRWLEAYGVIEGQFNYQLDKFGLKTDDLEVELKLQAHIPEFLPMFGRRIRIYYVGMKKQCNNCFELGHLKANCGEDRKDWFSYIEDLLDSGNFTRDLFGEWPEVIKRKRAENKAQAKQKSKPKDNVEAKENKTKEDNGTRRGGQRNRGRGRGKQ